MKSTVWVRTTHNGQLTGGMTGHLSRQEAERSINNMRLARDASPTHAAFRDGYDWHIIEFSDDESGSYTITY